MDILNKINVNATDVALKDGIFDISEYNNGASYASLSAALAAVPSSVSTKGGVSVKFKDSTTSRYEQYRLRSNDWSNNVNNWEYIISDGIYDISAMNSNTTYADLTTALNVIPTNHRKGGMTVRYVQTSDNKYVQFRLMSDEWSTTPSDWQGVDTVPVNGSMNLVESGGVYKATGNPSIDIINVGEGNVGFITNNGGVGTLINYRYSEPIFIERDCIVVAICKIGTSASAIATTNEQGSYYIPCIIGKDSTSVLTYSYSAKAGEYIVVSWDLSFKIILYSLTSVYSEYGKEIREIGADLKATIPLKSIISSVDYTRGIFYDGQVGDELVINYSSTAYCCIIKASKGDVFDITGSMPSSNAACLIVDDNNIILRRYNFASTGNNGSIIIEDDNASFIIIQTNNLDYSGCVKHSNEVPQIKPTENDYDLAIRDYNGYILAMFNNGHIKTKNFDSSKSIGFASNVISKYNGKKISILGDSISTFGDPDSRNENGTYCYSYYPTETCRYSVDGTVGSYQSIKFDVENTYWMKLIRATSMVLGINESWRGSMVSGSGNNAFNYQTRINRLGSNGTPDVILVYGGTNDAGGSVSLGTFNTENPQNYTAEQIAALPVTTFADGYRTMLIRLMKTYPMAEIVVILPTFTTSYYTITNLDSYVEIIKEACDFFGIKYIDTRCTGINVYNSASYTVDGIHPNVAGMQLLFEKIYRQLIFV